MLHLGVGAFHRAHQAMYLNRLIESGDAGWRIAAGNIRPDASRLLQDLHAQNGCYTLETVTPEGVFSYERIGSITQILPWSEDLAAIVACGRSSDTGIISFTVTEAGYYLDRRRQLDLSYPDLHSDLLHGTRLTIYGAVGAILRARMDDDAGPVTLLCCDNIRSNGDHFRSGLFDFLARRGAPDLLHWAQNNTTCPNAMVDRITPRASAAVQDRVFAATGMRDECAVMAEDFCQWVIEDHFCNGRPRLEAVGVQLVDSVLPYEEAKIRILNASHSGIAWFGALRGYATIDEALRDPEIRQAVTAYVTQDVIACLSPSPVDLPAYRDTVLHRFSNPHIRDTIERVAADGFAKIPGFIAPTIAEQLAAGRSFSAAAMLPALFLAFLQQRAAGGIGFPYQDQAMDETAVQQILAAADPIAAFCGNTALWGALAGHPLLEAAVRQAYSTIRPAQKKGFP
jgi:D-arabinitol 4-dehydrogenase